MVFEENGEEYEETKVSTVPVIISFLVGGVVGSLATFFITRKQMRKEKEKEINDVLDYYSKPHPDDVEPVSFDGIIEEDHPKDDLPPEDRPFPISQDDYINDSDFKKETLIYYEDDDVLTDSYDREVFVEDTIGRECLKEFGKYENDVSYARNEKLGYDYEVILEHKSFASLLGEEEIEGI